ncbi:MAG: tRNA (N6-threonylcarbamoyladenosine(37)-N6)-methyltransferase TrmO [Eubacteriales bacterium]|nr:tRNA (N6-threonylcarbamoyladenosine(37)-N6)-methyltransferase TrmO [Eubacteriales bacterium]
MESLKVIARLRNDFSTKFGLPRQSGLVEGIRGTIVFEGEFRNPDALRGLEGYSHIWLLWGFDRNKKEGWSATVRPPRLGGNARMGVFATRSPFRPNPIGLSCVKIEEIEKTEQHGVVLHVSGADMADGTPIYDIKPYLPHVDSRPEATAGFAGEVAGYALEVEFPQELLEQIEPEKREALVGALRGDPRPSYQSDPERVYGFFFAGRDIRFRVRENVLRVVEIVPQEQKKA